MIRPTISYSDVERIATQGSPVLLTALGRMFGLGPAERQALGSDGMGGIPRWVWVTVALGGGFVAGVRVYKRWPDKIPALIQGE